MDEFKKLSVNDREVEAAGTSDSDSKQIIDKDEVQIDKSEKDQQGDKVASDEDNLNKNFDSKLQKKYDDLFQNYKQQGRNNISLQAALDRVLDSHGKLITDHLQLLMTNFEEKFPKEKIQESPGILENQNKNLAEQLTKQKEDHEKLLAKHDNLTNKIREHLECPVCFDVPKTGPIPVCTNGHFVCQTCKRDLCPSCRVKLQGGKSILASNLLNLIPHKCVFEDCQDLFYLDRYESHLKICPHRLLKCPAVTCTTKVSFSKLIDHVLNFCNESFSDLKHCGSSAVFPIHMKMSFFADSSYKKIKMTTFLFDDQYFFLNLTRSSTSLSTNLARNQTAPSMGSLSQCAGWMTRTSGGSMCSGSVVNLFLWRNPQMMKIFVACWWTIEL